MSEEGENIPMEGEKQVAKHPDTNMQGEGEDLSSENDKGITKHIKRIGEDTDHPFVGDNVTVHYTGFFPSGEIFDSSKHRNEPFNFNVGKGEVIKGWDTVIPTMKKGEVCVITCKPEYAYGAPGSPPRIPENATLMFEIELISWKGEDISKEKDESIVRRVLEKGEGYESPVEGATVEAHIIGKCNGVVFEDRDVNFILGEGLAIGVLESIEDALLNFSKGEKSLLHIKASKGYGSAGCPEKNIPPNAALEYEVSLNKFENCKESWEMDYSEKLEQGDILKQKGTKYFKEQQWQLAKKSYQKIVDNLDVETNLEEERQKKKDALLLAAHLNLAMVYLKLADHNRTVDSCNSALEIDAKNEKAFFRRGQALASLQEFEDAISDFKTCLEIDPNNKAAKNQLAVAQQDMKKYMAAEKQRYSGMFSKFASIDSKKAMQEEYRNNDGKVFRNVAHWDNDLAKGMMTLEEEAEAFGDTAPEPKFNRNFSSEAANLSTDED